MARQEDACWRCGRQWATEDGSRPTLTVIAGAGQLDAAIAFAARAGSTAHSDSWDRWATDGGSMLIETAARAR